MSLSFSKTLLSSSTPNPLFLDTNFSNLTLHPRKQPSSFIRMGGGPRTFPGGVSKWQWKRMQSKKSKQLLKARLCRERQIYEMRKRAELKAAVTELERPWEPVQSAPNLFSVTADEQMKVLADRFQKPGGFDLWTERDGPQLFEIPHGSPLPTARFFPKGVVHSVKPYGRVNSVDDEFGSDSDDDVESVTDRLVLETERRPGKVKTVARSLRTEPERRSEMKTGGTRKTWRKKKEQASFNSRKREDMTGDVYDSNSQTKWGYRFRDKNGGFDSDCEVKMAEFQELE